MSTDTKYMQQYLEKLVTNNFEIQHEHEQFLGQHYNDMLDYPNYIQKIQISIHYRILKIALDYDQNNKLNYEKIIMYIINQLDKGKLDTNVLLVLIDPIKLKREDLFKITKCKNVNYSFFKIPYSFIFETIENESKQHQNAINILQQTILDGFSQLKNLCDMMTSFKKELSSKIDQNKDTINDEIRSIKDQISKTIDDNKSIQLISTKIDNNELIVKSELLDIKNHILVMLNNNRNEMKFDMDKTKQDISNEISDIKNTVISDIKNLETKILKKVEDNKHLIESESQKINDLFPNKINECKNFITTKIGDVKSQISTSIKNIENNKKLIESESQKINDLFPSKIKECVSSITEEISNVKRQISENTNDIKRTIHSEIVNSDNKLLKTIKSAQKSISSDISTIFSKKNSETTKNVIDSITTVISSTKTQISSSISQNKNDLVGEIQIVKDNMQKINDKSQEISEISSKLDLIKKSICSEISNTKNQLFQKIDKNESEIKSEIKNSENNNKFNIIEENEEIIEKIEFVSNFVTFKEILPIKFNFDKDKSDWNGLFDFCYSKIGNPFESRIFEITGNSEEGYEDALKCIGDPDNEKDWKSKDSKDSFIKIDFKNKKFFFEGIEICNHSESCNTLKELLLKGSNDDSDWTTIESWSELDEVLPGPNSCCSVWTYNTSQPNDFYRFLKLEINGKNTSNNQRLCLKNIELYGTSQ